MNWKVTTAPTSEPITTAELKTHLRVDGTDEDTYIESLIPVAREYCEKHQNRAYLTQTITIKLTYFPDYIELPKPPLQSVTHIKYIDTEGDEQTLDESVYDVDTTSEPGRIVLAYNQTWPGVRGDINGIEIVCVCGYTSADEVPARVKQSMFLICGHLYENRELTTPAALEELPFAVKSLLSFDRVNLI